MHSEHFSESELACRHCGRNECKPELLQVLEALRRQVNRRYGRLNEHEHERVLVVHSAYRCAEHNAAVRGARTSKHVLGQAADVSSPGLTAAQLQSAAIEVPGIHGIGRDDKNGFLHVDIREVPARWCYADGQPVAYYPPGAKN